MKTVRKELVNEISRDMAERSKAQLKDNVASEAVALERKEAKRQRALANIARHEAEGAARRELKVLPCLVPLFDAVPLGHVASPIVHEESPSPSIPLHQTPA